MFQVNDYLAYGNSGVCKVIEIGTPDMNGIDKSILYYTLQPVYSKGSIIYTPTGNENKAIRKILSEEEALDLINDIPNIETIQESNDKLREIIYKEAMKKHECREWVKIIKTLYLKNKQRLLDGKKIASTDLRYLHEAEECLYGELSIPLGIPKDNMEDLINNKIDLLI
ncbi:MAG: CarD family transcriptional regulator [Herbinix sp.]|nr:CarD family transcriptional regulator [Herbinix sp.]